MSRAGQGLKRAVSVSALAVALGCGSGDAGDQKTPPPPETRAAPAPRPVAPVDPPPQAALHPGDPAAGAPHYANYCASCHGDRGCGDGPLAGTLDPKPAKHCDGLVMNDLEDAYLVTVVGEGGPAVGKSAMMAPWAGTLSDQQILDVVAFIRTLADPPYPKQ